MTTDYAAFLARKHVVVGASGHDVDPADLHAAMFDHQRYPTAWAIRKGRGALFLDTGLGKTLAQLVWAQQVADRSLILAPLAVARQTVAEGAKWGIEVVYARRQAEAPARGITITNYEMLDRFDPAAFGAVVLDESSILKNFEGKTRTALIGAFADTPYRLCCTATPAPNDHAELGNHAEFLGVMTRTDMLATFFVHDDAGWRLKGHAREPFYRWLASWAMSLRRPADLGYPNDGYDLPPLEILPAIVPSDYAPAGQLLATGLKGVGDRARVRRGTVGRRVAAAADLIAAEPGEQWIAWVGTNDEERALAALVPDALVVTGSQDPDEKAARLERFAAGRARVLVTKPSIAAWGLNFQGCARMAFVGLGDSFESYYQAIRRCWRFGQTRSVRAHVVLSDLEEPIYHNVLRKEREADAMAAALVRHVAAFERAELGALAPGRLVYAPAQPMRLPAWLRSVA